MIAKGAAAVTALSTVALACCASAATQCRVIEYADHFEATCTGEASPGGSAPQGAAQQSAAVQQPPQRAPTPTEGVQEESAFSRSDLAKRHGAAWLRMRRGR